MSNLRKILGPHGRIHSVNAYFDSKYLRFTEAQRLEFQDAGQCIPLRALSSESLTRDSHFAAITLIDCPHGGKHEVIDRMIIEGIDTIAWSQSKIVNDVTICVISGDGDFALKLQTAQNQCVPPLHSH